MATFSRLVSARRVAHASWAALGSLHLHHVAPDLTGRPTLHRGYTALGYHKDGHRMLQEPALARSGLAL